MKGTCIITPLLLLTTLFGWSQDQAQTLTIDRAIELALQNNHQYLISQEGISQAKCRLSQNIGYLPTITLEGFKNLKEKLRELEFDPMMGLGDSSGEKIKTTIDFTMNYEFTLRIVQPVFSGGKIFHNLKNAGLDVKIAKERSENTRDEVILNVKRIFYNILVTRELLQVHREAMELAQRNHDNIKASYDLGLASKYDLLRAEMAVATIKPNVLKVEKILTIMKLNLKFMIGISEEKKIVVTGELDFNPKHLDTAFLIDQALMNRSELIQMKMEKDKIGNLLKIAYGQFLPDISIVASYNYYSNFFNFRQGNWGDYYTINLAISFPIFTGLKRTGQIGELKVMKKIVKLNLQQLADSTRTQVKDLYLTLKEELENIQLGAKNIETAKEGARIAELNYNEGLISVLELNSSTNELTRARVAYLQSIYNYNIALCELEKITGIKINGGK